MHPMTTSDLFLLLKELGLPADLKPDLSRLFDAIDAGHTALKLDRGRDESWSRALNNEDLCQLLAVNHQFLQIRRHFAQEKRVAADLRRRALSRTNPALIDPLHFMPHADSSQQAAIVGAAARTLSMVSGGPGTGKTTTAAAIVAAKLRLLGETPRISLVAPTGKAAARLTESFQAAVSNMDQPDTRLNEVVATTIHRQINTLGDSQVVLVDEASMVSLDLFDRLLKALSPDSHVILMGDPNQLASIEAGNILKTISESEGLSSHCFKLTNRHRIQGQETLATLQDLCLRGDSEGFIECIRESDVFWEPNRSADHLKTYLFNGLKPYLDSVKTAKQPERSEFQCLTAINEGIGGRRFVNHLVQAECQQLGLRGVGERLLVTENQPSLGIFNGDIGVVIDSNDTLNPQVQFDTLSTPLMRNQLGWVEPAWAISIHRSQGSEYQSVLVCLPEPGSIESRFRPNRELLYTALTRAKQSVGLFASERMLQSALQHTTQRITCLGYFLNE